MIHKIEFIVKGNKSLAKSKTSKKNEKLFFIYNHGNNIHEHGKQQNE